MPPVFTLVPSGSAIDLTPPLSGASRDGAPRMRLESALADFIGGKRLRTEDPMAQAVIEYADTAAAPARAA
jgi:hypothetical protein